MWVEASRRLKVKTGTAVMAVHHSGKPKDNGSTTERGSSALRAAAETMIRVTLDEKKGVVTIKNDKQKEDEPFERFVTEQAGHRGLRRGRCTRDLALLVPSSPTTSAADAERVGMSNDVTPALEALRAFPSGEADSGEWRVAIITKNGQPASESSFHRWRKKLLALGLIEEVPTKTGRYRVVPTPTEVPPESHESGPLQDYHHSHHPVGVGVEVAGEEVKEKGED